VNADERVTEFARAVARLGEALVLSANNPLGVDASIQRFEFTIELAWKCLRDILLRDHAIETASPKTTMQQAFRVCLVDDETLWLAMLRDRNLSAYTYREALAREIFARLPDYLTTLTRLATTLRA